MKKLFSALLVAAILASFLCLPVFAADPPTESGIYDVTKTDNFSVTFEVQKEDGTKVDGAAATINDADATFYADTVKVKITVTGLSDGKYYLGLCQTATGVPDKDNIAYIDQATAASGTVEFTVYPEKLDTDKTYYVYLSSSEATKADVLNFKYYAAYVLGDVNEDGQVNGTDALWALQRFAGNRTLTANQELAANVTAKYNNDKSINGTDALWILQVFAGNRNKDFSAK